MLEDSYEVRLVSLEAEGGRCAVSSRQLSLVEALTVAMVDFRQHIPGHLLPLLAALVIGLASVDRDAYIEDDEDDSAEEIAATEEVNNCIEQFVVAAEKLAVTYKKFANDNRRRLAQRHNIGPAAEDDDDDAPELDPERN